MTELDQVREPGTDRGAPYVLPSSGIGRDLAILTILGVAFYLFVHLTDFELFERFHAVVRRHDTWQLDELLILGNLLFVIALVLVASRWRDFREAADRLVENERQLREAERVANVGNWSWDVESGSVVWSNELFRLFGRDPDTFQPSYSGYLEHVHPAERESVDRMVREALESRGSFKRDVRIVTAEGASRWIHSRGRTVTDPDGTPIRMVGIAQDITTRKEAIRSLREAQALHQTVFEVSPVVLTVGDEQGRIIEANRAFSDLTGLARAEVIGRTVGELDIWADPGAADEIRRRLEETGRLEGTQALVRDREGVLRELQLDVESFEEDGRRRYVWCGQDVTERNEARRRLERQALHDELTDLPNRNLLIDRIEHALVRSVRSGERLCLLFLDLDGFKAVNDAYGHAVGDRTLVRTARRLETATREEDTVARISGDEFVCLLEDADETVARRVAERILERLARPMKVMGEEVRVGASIGIVVSSPEHDSPHELLQASDAAMYTVKQSRRGSSYHIYEKGDARAGERLRRRSRLERAVRKDELVLYYQPVVELESGDIAGVEALVRWQEPDRGLVPPAEFLPLAEATGLVVAIDRWTLSEAVRQTAAWRDAGLIPEWGGSFRTSVNVSPQLIDENAYGELVIDVLAARGLDPSTLQVEVTEREAIHRPPALEAIREAGVTLAIDDFGTGYASLRNLRFLEADVIKVDQFFVQDLDRADETSVIVKAVLTIAMNMELEVVAEGVETESQRKHLLGLGCRLGQGYLFSRPVSPKRMTELLEVGTVRTAGT